MSTGLWRSAQPTAAGFAELKRRGVKTIVNLRSVHSDRELLTGTGLQYVEIPCQAWHPEQADVLKFLKIVADPRNQPVLLHCQHGADRTGLMIAAYRMVEDHWTAAEAIKELPNFHFHPMFGDVIEFLKKFDPEITKKNLATVASPKVEIVQ